MADLRRGAPLDFSMYAAVPLGPKLLEELEQILGVCAVDPTDVDKRRKRSMVELQPEQRLMLDVLWLAVIDSQSKKSNISGPARAWLRMAPGFSAEEVCQHLGWDYDAVLSALERRWK